MTSFSSSQTIPLFLALKIRCVHVISGPGGRCYQKGDSSFLLEAPFHRFLRTPDLALSKTALKTSHAKVSSKFQAPIVPNLLQACNFDFL